MAEPGAACRSLSEILELRNGDLVSIMGAGGKATTMKRLLRELLDRRIPILVTSTTNLHALGGEGAPSLLLSEGTRADVQDAIRKWTGRGAVVWVEKKLPQNMFRGLPVGQVEEMHGRGFDGVLIVKTDGARKRLAKAPGADEPIVPRSATHCLVVMGLNAIGRPAGPDVLHRFERTCAVAGLKPGQTIGARHLAAIAAHPESYPGRLPAGARKALYLSHCIGEADLENARAIWDAMPAGLYDLHIAGDTVEGRFYPGGKA